MQPPNSAMCQVRHLRSVDQWEHDDTIAALPDDISAPEVKLRAEALLIPHMTKSCYALLREYAHYERFDETYRRGTEWVINIESISSDHVATSIQAQMVLKSDDNHEGWKLPGHAVTLFRAPSASARSAEGTPIVDPITVTPVTTQPIPDIYIDPAEARVVAEILLELLPQRPGLTSLTKRC